MTTKTFTIKESRIEELDAMITKINRKAAKLGVDPVSVSETSRKFHQPTKWNAMTQQREPKGSGFFLVDFVANGSAPKLPGWSLVARLEHDPAIGTLVHAVPGQDVPSKFQDASHQTCDHCKTKRFRKDTFVLRHEYVGPRYDHGEFVQVGRQCIKDFLGGQSPENVLQKLEWFTGFFTSIGAMDYDEDRDEYRGNDPRFSYENLLQLVTTVVRVIHVDGWKSRTAAKEADFQGQQSQASVDTALWLMTSNSLTEADRVRYAKASTDVEEAKLAIEWAATQDGESDYESNLRKIAQSDVTSHRSAGIAGSIPAAFSRHQERELKKANDAKNSLNEWYGKTGDKIDLVLEVQFVNEYESQWGVSTLIRFKDEAGRTFTWWASKVGIYKEFETQTKYAIRGTVKKLDEYKGLKQTVLTRCSSRQVEVAA